MTFFRGLDKTEALALAIASELSGEPIPTDLALALGSVGITIDVLEGLSDLTVYVDVFSTRYEDGADYEDIIEDFSGNAEEYDLDGSFADYADYPIGGTD